LEKETTIFNKLFYDWNLETWANVLEVVGFAFAIFSFIIALIIKSEVKKLKTDLIFDKRIKKHTQNLENSASKINNYLNNYDENKKEIKTEFSICIAELQDLKNKLSFYESIKIRWLIRRLKNRRNCPLANRGVQSSTLIQSLKKYPKRIYETNYEDVWIIYDRLLEVIRQMENIKENKNKSR
jgi:hypothetical protein